jgi:hypothetical protein
MKNLVNEELNKMKYLLGYQRGMVISEQTYQLQRRQELRHQRRQELRHQRRQELRHQRRHHRLKMSLKKSKKF